MRTTIFISFPHSCMVEFERAGIERMYFKCLHAHPQSSFPSPHPPTRNLPHCTSSISKIPSAYNPPDAMDRSCQRPRDQLFCSVRWRMQCMATSTRNNSSVSLNSLAVSIPGFFLFGRFAASWARALSERNYGFIRAPCSNSFFL
jgi:hypothetical protein